MLLVEDHLGTRKVLRSFLASRGWEVVEAATIAEGLTRLDLDDPYGCVVLDLSLPDGAGEVVLRKIRTQGLPIRVVVHTGTDDGPRLREVSYMRPDAVVQKPIDPEQLCALCESPTPAAAGSPGA